MTIGNVYVAIYLIFSIGVISAGPENLSVVSGDVELKSASQLCEITATDRSILEWDSFSIREGETVQFFQPSEIASVLNRVTGPNLSEIYGNLQANGKVYLINPSGIIFGEKAVVDTSSFLASTLDISNADFSQGNELLCIGDSEANLVQLGTIRAKSGDIFLIARKIEQKGVLSAAKGDVSLSAGTEILLKPKSCPLINLSADLCSSRIENSGEIEALNAYIQADSCSSFALEQDGEITLLEEGGKILLSNKGEFSTVGSNAHLKAPNGEITILQEGESPLYLHGVLDVSGPSGGHIQIKAPKLLNNAQCYADGVSGPGGSISISIEKTLIETASASFSANGTVGGSISQFASHLFTSGSYTAQGEVGGNLTLLGDDLTLAAANLDASGTKFGGQILIGGDFQGKNPSIYNAKNVLLTTSTQIHADGGEKGGRVIIWSDGVTRNLATVSARSGGFIEVSGKEELIQIGGTDAGVGGEVLFDPLNITIAISGGSWPNYLLVDPNSGSGTGFGEFVEVLVNGNIVVSKPGDSFAATSSGAVFLYDGLTGGLISMITGSTLADQVGGGIRPLTNGNFVILSPNWDRVLPSVLAQAGAATWSSGIDGVSGTVSVDNSLIGSTAGDLVGAEGVALTNGNYVIKSFWTNPSGLAVGAATWGNGYKGTYGTISSINSLVGSTNADQVGTSIVALTNGNYVTYTPHWSRVTSEGTFAGAGAVTFGNGARGTNGIVSITNSLVGSSTGDNVGSGGVTALSNGNYVIVSTFWDDGSTADVGAVTWGSGIKGTVGAITSSNSIIGVTASDRIGSGGIIALENGNYVILSPLWDNGGVADAGAATWGDGTLGVSSVISSSNSLIGSTANDQVGSGGGLALTNGNYIVFSPNWDDGGTSNVGAATWADGSLGVFGTIGLSNSLIGSTASDQVGSGGGTALTNGNYVVLSPNWDNGGTSNAGAVTWGDGTVGISGTVTTANSTFGATANNQVGSGGAAALASGNYVVLSPLWDNGGTSNVGAATWRDGSAAATGAVTSVNSLIGSTASDGVGTYCTVLVNDNYVIGSPLWDNGGTSNVGAATWCNGITGTTGTVSSANSLIGTTANDRVSQSKNDVEAPINGIVALSTGDYLVTSVNWDNGATANAGAVTVCNGIVGTTGTVSTGNSVVGGVANSGLISPVDNTAINSTFVCPFPTGYTGGEEVVRIGIARTVAPNLAYSLAFDQNFTVSPSFVTSTLATGTAVNFQANLDITVTDAVSYNTGNLTLSAGRSAFINADITTGGANLIVIANDSLSGGVIDSSRSSGTAVLTINTGITIDGQGGSLSFSILSDPEKTNNMSGNLTLSGGATLTTTGTGTITLSVTDHSISLLDTSTISSGTGNVILTAGEQVLIGN